MSPTRAVIFANGTLPDPEAARRLLRPGDTLLAADGGTHHLLALGRIPAVVIGDLDSVTDEERRLLDQAGASVRKYPRDKDETDLELAMRHAVETGHRQILVVGGLGGRLDQALGNLSLLADPARGTLDVRLDDGVEEAFFVHPGRRSRVRGGGREVRGSPGEIVSLIPWGSPAEGVVTEGLRWPLHGETLFPHRTRGVSNELTGETASVTLTAGLLLVVHRRNPQPSSVSPQS